MFRFLPNAKSTHAIMIEIFQAAQNGDGAAFEQIWGQFHVRLASFVKTRLRQDLRSVVDVDDVLQETSLRAFDSIGLVQWQGENALFCWFCGIALNVVRRTAARYIRLSDADTLNDVSAGSDRPSQGLRRSERFDRLEAALGKLSEEHRQVIIMARIDGHSVKEIAKRLDRTPEAIYKLLARALRKLKEVFGDTKSFGLAGRQFVRTEELRGDDRAH